MLKYFVMICVILVVLPTAKSTLAAPLNDAGTPARLYGEQKLVNVTGPAKSALNGSSLSKIKNELAKDGWKVVGKPYYAGGRWLLKFSRVIVMYEGAFSGVLMPDMYWDKLAGCVKWKSNHQPAAGMPCNEKG